MSENLEQRTLKFSERIIAYIGKLHTDLLIKNVVEQLLRSATSIGANYREACGANSKRDFINKLAISRKEAKETYYWLSLLQAKYNSLQLQELKQESHELVLILSKALRSSQNK
jgi:four helix bundle protein